MNKHIRYLFLLFLLAGLAAGCTSAAFSEQTAENSFVPSPVQSATPAPTPIPTPSPTPIPTPFSIVWMTDTQAMSCFSPEALDSMGCYIRDNLERENILCVFHTGDLVDNGFRPYQWDNFNLALEKFRGMVPFYPVAGNHDIGVRRHSYDGYLHCDFLNDLPADKCFADGLIYYDLFSAGGADFIVLGVGYNTTRRFPGAYDWINDALAAHRDRVGIVLIHRYIDGRGRLYKSSYLDQDELLAKNPNVRLVLCGHNRGDSLRTDEFDDDGDGTPDRTVYSLMYNPQGDKKEGYGYLRLLRFDPAVRSIETYTYSPFLDKRFADPKTGEYFDHVLTDAF